MSRGHWVRILAHRVTALALTVVIFALIFRRVPLERLVDALAQADHGRFLALMITNTAFYFCWDTLVLTVVVRWFHGPVRWRELLPVRASSYVVGFFNTNAGRGALALYLSRRLQAPFLQLGSTVIFLLLTEYTQLVVWSTAGLIGSRAEVTATVVTVAGGVAAFWLVFLLYARLNVTPGSVRWLFAPREWQLFRTFRLAPAHRYAQIVLLRAPMFLVSLILHYFAAPAFGIHIPFVKLLAFLPVIFMIAALPITVGHLGSTQAAWLFFFGEYAPAPQLLALSLSAHLVFTTTRAAIGLALLPYAYRDFVAPGPRATWPDETRSSAISPSSRR